MAVGFRDPPQNHGRVHPRRRAPDPRASAGRLARSAGAGAVLDTLQGEGRCFVEHVFIYCPSEATAFLEHSGITRKFLKCIQKRDPPAIPWCLSA